MGARGKSPGEVWRRVRFCVHIAARFRSRGICVAMGGPHATLLPKEASRHADGIFIGEAEGSWEDFLKSFESGTYLRVYQHTSVPSMENIPEARKDLFHRRDHTNGVLFATRGCPGQCDFCTIAVMCRHQLRQRPIAEVAAEYSKRLFRAIAPYRKWWSSQVSIHAGRDDEFLELAARSGCKQLFLGLESISRQSAADVNKGFNRVEEYLQIIDRIHSHGIAVQAGIVFGFDHDTPRIFEGVNSGTGSEFRKGGETRSLSPVSLSWPSAPSRPGAAACLASGWLPGRCGRRPTRWRPRAPGRPASPPTAATRERRWAWSGAAA